MTTSWCILRTAPSRTLPLVRSLTAAGYEAWTPQETLRRRATRSRIEKEIVLPITPSIAFAEYERLPELVMLSRMPTPMVTAWDEDLQAWHSKSVPPFRVFRYLDGYPRVADRELDALRISEQRIRPKRRGRTFVPGETVKLIGGAFEGLIGTVTGARGQHTVVTFGDWPLPVSIVTSALLPCDKQAA